MRDQSPPCPVALPNDGLSLSPKPHALAPGSFPPTRTEKVKEIQDAPKDTEHRTLQFYNPAQSLSAFLPISNSTPITIRIITCFGGFPA